MAEQPKDVRQTPPRRLRRRILWWCSTVLSLLVLVPVLMLVAVIWMAMDNVLRLPDGVQTMIETRLDRAMAANQVEIGDIGLALREGGVTPQIVLSDVVLRDGDDLRARFPELSVHLNGRALLRGEMRPYRVDLTGAGLRMVRDAEGRLDLALTDERRAEARDLTETLARIDAMFAQPIFAELQEISGRGLELILNDAVTGREMRAHDANLRLERKGAALTLIMGGQLEGSRNASLSLAVTRNPELGRTDMRAQFQNLAARDVASAAPALAWLDLMRAPISGALTTRLRDDGTVGDLSGALDIGEGRISLGEGVAPLPFTALSAYFDYDAAAARLSFSALDVDAPALQFRATGNADLMQDGTSYVGQFHFTGIEAAPEGIFAAPVQFEGGAMDMRLSLSPFVRLELGQAVLFDGALHLSAEGEIAARPDGLSMRIDATIPEIAVTDVLPYWPTGAIPNTRGWLDRNLTGGTLRDIRFSLRQEPGGTPAQMLRLDFEESTIRALRQMPPIEDARGYVSLTGPRFVMSLSAGGVTGPLGGSVGLAGSTMVIEDVRVRGPDTAFDLRAQGELRDVLSLLELPPVNLFSEGRLSAETLATGRADLRGRLSVPLRQRVPFEAIEFEVSGRLADIRSDTLVAGRVVSADSLEVEVVPDRVAISGRARLDGIAATGRWTRALGPGADGRSRLEGTGVLSPDGLADFGVVLPDGLVTGSTGADFVLELGGGDGPPDLVLSSDLSGLGLRLDALSWQKPEGQTGRLAATVRLGDAPGITSLELAAAGLELQGDIRLREGGGFDRLTATRFRLNDWLDVTGALVGRGQARAPSVELTGGSVDLRRVPSVGGGARGGAGSGPLTVRLDRLQISDGIALNSVAADLTTTGGLSGQFRGEVNGAVPVTGTLVTTANGAAVRLRSNDGGAVMRAAGLFENAYGGEMELVMQPTGQTGAYIGQLTINGPRLRNAPAMAELLNAVSIVGLLEQLGDTGINLGEVEARFRLDPRAIVVEQGTAVGPSMGISMDGVYDIANRRFDMQGVVSPLYMVNGVLGALFAPRREGLFGVTYRLTGTPENTRVAVNPLSILTPGIFREIFRRPPPELSQ
ncbi:AsmA-like C-terminal region-containing protein [Boseongicola sp. H5]|uniref:YhdP family protein n=1 Tax=Boseongicola sp. H5 TaxID=2763261 RepID=UPI001D0B39CB|nr:AsmA-like C-terminal region-containing protein [Boseongicola sp. H5]